MFIGRNVSSRGGLARRGSWSFPALLVGFAVMVVACAGGGAATAGGGPTGGATIAPGGPSSSDTAGGAGASSAGAAGPIPAGLVDPCGLLSTEAAAKAAGGTVLAGIRDPEEDGTYVQCLWRNDRAFLAGETDFAPPIAVFLTARTDAIAEQLEASIGSGSMDVLSGTAASRAAVTSADLGTAGVAGAAGIKGEVYFKITCWSPQVPTSGAKKPSKAICGDAAKAVAAALP